MKEEMDLLSVVALTEDMPEHGLLRGQVGTIVEMLAPGAFEVEFSSLTGQAYAMVSVRTEKLMILHYRPFRAA